MKSLMTLIVLLGFAICAANADAGWLRNRRGGGCDGGSCSVEKRVEKSQLGDRTRVKVRERVRFAG